MIFEWQCHFAIFLSTKSQHKSFFQSTSDGKQSCPILHSSLTHWGRVTHIRISNVTIIGSDNGLSPGRCQAIIWTKYENIVYWTFRNKLQWNLNWDSYIFIQYDAFEYGIWKMVAILSQPQCVKLLYVHYDQHSREMTLAWVQDKRDIFMRHHFICWIALKSGIFVLFIYFIAFSTDDSGNVKSMWMKALDF